MQEIALSVIWQFATMRVLMLGSGADFEAPAHVASALLDELETCAKSASEFRCYEYSVRMHLLRGELLLLLEREKEARVEGDAALQLVDEGGAKHWEETAQGLAGGSAYSSDMIENMKKEFEIFRKGIAQIRLTPRDQKSFAEFLMQALGLPSDRFPVVLDNVEAIHVRAKEKYEWCRYLLLEENRSHCESRETMYACRPEQRCRCEELNYTSGVPNEDWRAVLQAFKQTYCTSCDRRFPYSEDFPDGLPGSSIGRTHPQAAQ